MVGITLGKDGVHILHFCLQSVNTLTVTYYLAIDRAPYLKEIFPSFVQYVAIISFIGVPMLALIGYLHYKKTQAYRSETDIVYETNPFARRLLVNTEILVSLNLQLLEDIVKLSQNEKISDDELEKFLKCEMN